MSNKRVPLLGVGIDAMTLPDLLGQVAQAVRSGAHQMVLYVNVYCMNIAWRESRYRRLLNRADVVYCDGAGVVWGARFMGRHLPPRMTGADWIYDLCRQCQGNGQRLFLLGGEPGTADRARQILEDKFPGLNVVSARHGYFRAEESPDLVAEINRCAPDILLVGLGSPLQEYWIEDHFERLQVPVVWAMGAVMDYVVQKVPRAPHWMRDRSLEWLFRLMIEPKRMWRRYVVGNPLFLWHLLITRCGWAKR